MSSRLFIFSFCWAPQSLQLPPAPLSLIRRASLRVRAALLDKACGGVMWQQQVTWDDDVMVLNGRNFDRMTQKVPHILVEVYAPWCGHCQKFEPIYRLFRRACVSCASEWHGRFRHLTTSSPGALSTEQEGRIAVSPQRRGRGLSKGRGTLRAAAHARTRRAWFPLLPLVRIWT